jgi:predicted amidohydrolase
MKKLQFKKLSLLFVICSLVISQALFADVIKPINEVFTPSGTFPETQFWKVATIQWNPEESARIDWDEKEAEAFKQNNREEMAKRITIAANSQAKYISLPEFAVDGYPDIPELPSEEDNYRTREDIKNLVETIPGASTEYFSKLAKSLNIWIQFGLAEKDAITDLYYNSVVVINPEGQIIAKYRKQHLFEIEHHYLEAGSENIMFNTPAGKFGLIICSDSYADEVISLYKKSGANVLSLSTSWARMNSGMNQFKATAKAAGAYVLAANQSYFPDTGVVNPNGSIQSHIRQTLDGIAYGFLPLIKK